MVFISGQLLIKNAVAFIAERSAAETIITIHQVAGEINVMAILAVLGEKGLKAAAGVHNFIAEFRVGGIGQIQGVLGIQGDIGIGGVLAGNVLETQIAVFLEAGRVSVFSIYHSGVFGMERRPGHFIQQFLVLLKKRSGKIIIPPVTFWVPLVAPPDILLIDLVGQVRMINGNYALPG